MIVPPRLSENATTLAHLRDLRIAAGSMTPKQVNAAAWAMGGDPDWTPTSLARSFDTMIERYAAKVADEERHQAALERLYR